MCLRIEYRLCQNQFQQIPKNPSDNLKAPVFEDFFNFFLQIGPLNKPHNCAVA